MLKVIKKSFLSDKSSCSLKSADPTTNEKLYHATSGTSRTRRDEIRLISFERIIFWKMLSSMWRWKNGRKKEVDSWRHLKSKQQTRWGRIHGHDASRRRWRIPWHLKCNGQDDGRIMTSLNYDGSSARLPLKSGWHFDGASAHVAANPG